MSHIFISYSHQDKKYAHKLRRHLLDQGFDAWIDDRIDYGSHWSQEIEKQLRGSAAFILIMSSNSYKSDWVQNELSFARKLKKPIFPLLLEGDVWWHLHTTQYVDVKDEKLPPVKFFILLAEIVSQHKMNAHWAEKSANSRTDKSQETSFDKLDVGGNVSGSVIIAGSGNVVHLGHNGKAERQLEAEELARQKAAKEKADREAAEKVTREKAEREATEKARHEAVERADREKARQQAVKNRRDLIRKTILGFSLNLKSTIHKISPLTWTFALLLILGAILAIWNSPKATLLPFSGSEEGGVNIYIYDGKKTYKVTTPSQNVQNWSPVLGTDNNIYFASNRDGKFEIYRLIDSKIERVTTTPGKYESWSPAFSLNNDLYFTSNRDGKAEIYRLIDSKIERVTATPGEYESWSPAFSWNNDLYFTSDRDGKAEIYRLKDGSVERVTTTPGRYESWSPTFRLNNDLYFTSSRDGKAEIYRLKGGNIERITNTPGLCESWGAVAKGRDIYFTSCTQWGKYRVYALKTEPVAVSDILSWTKEMRDRLP